MKTNKAFSVIEAVIIVAVVAIVASLGMVLYNNLSGNGNSGSTTTETAVVETKVPAIVNSKGLESVDTALVSSGLEDLDDFSDLDAQLSKF